MESINLFVAWSGSVKNLLKTNPEVLISKNLVSIAVNFLNKSTFNVLDILLPVHSVK